MATALRATLAVRRALVATCDGAVQDPGLRADQAIAVEDGTVRWMGPDAERRRGGRPVGRGSIDAGGRLVSPGLVDSHTHLVFGDDGTRAEEFAALAAGASYAEIARAGGGIRATMRATRAASEDELLRGAVSRARRLLAWGVTTRRGEERLRRVGRGGAPPAAGGPGASRARSAARWTSSPPCLPLHALPGAAATGRPGSGR